MITLIVLLLIVCGIAGALIGNRSGHRFQGMFCGLLFGPIGVLAVALWKTPPPNLPARPSPDPTAPSDPAAR